jgi:hypothetical protein
MVAQQAGDAAKVVQRIVYGEFKRDAALPGNADQFNTQIDLLGCSGVAPGVTLQA